jgi:hypothetical protein
MSRSLLWKRRGGGRSNALPPSQPPYCPADISFKDDVTVIFLFLLFHSWYTWTPRKTKYFHHALCGQSNSLHKVDCCRLQNSRNEILQPFMLYIRKINFIPQKRKTFQECGVFPFLSHSVYLKNCVNSFSEIVNGLPHSKENLNQKSYISSGTLTLISFCGVESGCQSVILYGISCIWWHFNSFFRHFDPSVVAYNIYHYNYTTNELLLIKNGWNYFEIEMTLMG